MLDLDYSEISTKELNRLLKKCENSPPGERDTLWIVETINGIKEEIERRDEVIDLHEPREGYWLSTEAKNFLFSLCFGVFFLTLVWAAITSSGTEQQPIIHNNIQYTP